jgi:hypothetical protein
LQQGNKGAKNNSNNKPWWTIWKKSPRVMDDLYTKTYFSLSLESIQKKFDR